MTSCSCLLVESNFEIGSNDYTRSFIYRLGIFRVYFTKMNNEDIKECRKYERFPFREDILIDGSRMCRSINISESGLYISAIQSYKKNSVMDVSIPYKGKKLTVNAQVRHCQPGIGMKKVYKKSAYSRSTGHLHFLRPAGTAPYTNTVISMKTSTIKSLLTSLYQREGKCPSLIKRGKGRFFNR